MDYGCTAYVLYSGFVLFLLLFASTDSNVFVLLVSKSQCLCTPARATTCGAEVTAGTVRVEIILSLKEWGVCPGEEVLEDSARIVKILCPPTPCTNVSEWPAKNHSKVLAPSTAE
jgi:hypothetical protein